MSALEGLDVTMLVMWGGMSRMSGMSRLGIAMAGMNEGIGRLKGARAMGGVEERRR